MFGRSPFRVLSWCWSFMGMAYIAIPNNIPAAINCIIMVFICALCEAKWPLKVKGPDTNPRSRQ